MGVGKGSLFNFMYIHFRNFIKRIFKNFLFQIKHISYIDLIVQLRHCSCSCTYFSVRVCFTCCSTTLYIVRTTLLHKSTTTMSVIIWDQRSYSVLFVLWHGFLSILHNNILKLSWGPRVTQTMKFRRRKNWK